VGEEESGTGLCWDASALCVCHGWFPEPQNSAQSLHQQWWTYWPKCTLAHALPGPIDCSCRSPTHPPPQAGNDFLPNIPSIDIYDSPCGLDLLLAAYKEMLAGGGGHLTDGTGAIRPHRLTALLHRMARDEVPALQRRAVSVKDCAQEERGRDGRHVFVQDRVQGWCRRGGGQVHMEVYDRQAGSIRLPHLVVYMSGCCFLGKGQPLTAPPS
jgi:hypothetical protein